MTLLDRFHNFNVKYLARTPIANTDTKKNKDVFKADDYGEQTKKWNAKRSISPAKRRELALTTPFFMKASRKKNMDKIRAWFELINKRTGQPISDVDKKIIDDFVTKTNLKYKWLIASSCADIYGDGFILKKYSNDIMIRTEDGDIPDVSKPIPDDASLVDLELINPEYCSKTEYLNNGYKKIGVQHYLYDNPKTPLKLYIHPDRIIPFKDIELPFSKLGISKVDILINIIESEAEIDESVGRILKWFSHGIVEYKKTGMQPQEKKEMLKVLAEHPDYFANSEKYELKVHNPTAIDPKPFFDYILIAVACAFAIPTQVLTGVQIGKVTGAETGYGDYYRDIRDKQELIDSQLIISLYTEILKASGKEFKYLLRWNEIYVDELAEANMLGKRAATIQLLMNTNPPIITREEAREIFNTGKTYLKPNEKLDENTQPTNKQNTIIKPENPKEDEEIKWSSKYQEMIAKRKVQRDAEKEHKLGEEILKEQEQIFDKDGKPLAFKSDKEIFGK